MPDSLACPVCFEVFQEGAAFALHVASCSSASPSPPASPSAAAHCARCLHVYAAGALAHEISFHEHECARVNDELPDDVDDAVPKSKKPRNGARVAVAAPGVTLFPSSCFLCGNGGRGLLRCGGSCARAAHQNCIDQLQAPRTGQPLSGAEKKQAADAWKCAQCLRGLHRCQGCGFLGHEADAMKKCGVLDCGFFFHERCIPNAEDESVHAGFVCPRHTCATCGTQETDMRRCKSCQVCYHMTHLRCPRGSGAAAQTSSTPADGGLDPTNLFVCPRHDSETATSPISSPDASNSLRLRLAAGDVVLILEFSNALLPPSVKAAAPDAANHWGVVISAEETEPHGHGNQLLSVRMFADDNVFVVPNQYAVRVASTSDFARPGDLVRHCLQRHVMAELQLRQMAGHVDDAEAKRILRASNAAFAARLQALSVTESEATGDAELGLARWRRFLALPEPRHYDGLGDSAPIYLYLDTRGSRSGQQTSTNTNTSEAAVDVDGDVPMTDAGTDSGVATTDNNGAAGASSASPNAGQPRPSGAGKSPHEADAEKSGDKTVGDVMFLDKHHILSTLVSEENSTQQSQTSTQDTVMASTQDTEHESWSQATLTRSSPALDVTTSTVSQTTPAVPLRSNDDCSDVPNGVPTDANSGNKRPTEGASEGAKRQKINADSPVSWKSAVFTPTTIRQLAPGAILSGATLHMSPMSGSVRTMLPKKRKQLTRKQKVLAETPPVILEQLEREALRYLEEVDGLKPQPTALPADADAFPWAANAKKFRPAFYRPTVMLGHSGLRRPGVDAVSRLLVSQDKRSIKCFVQTADARAGKVSTRCDHNSKNKSSSSASPACVFVDLMSLRSVHELESVVRAQLVHALDNRTQYMKQHFGMDAHQAQRWLEQQRRRKVGEQPPISLWYCAADGVRRHLELGDLSKPSPKEKQAWLCFCANVCHVSVVIAVPHLQLSASTSMAAQSVAVAGTAK